MRVFNVRLAAILVSIVVLFGCSVMFLNGYQIRRNAKFFLNEARISQQEAAEAAKQQQLPLEEAKNREVINYLRWYVQLMPNDIDAMEELGIMLAEKSYRNDVVVDRRMFFNALDQLETVVRLAPERDNARRQLVKMAMLPQRRRYQDAKQYLQGYLLVKSPKNPDLLEQLGQCQVETGEFQSACETFKKSIASNPSQLTAYKQLADLLRFRLQQPEEADGWMKKMVEANPKSYKAHFLRSHYLNDSRVNQGDEAMEEASKALKLAPDDAEVLITAAACDIAKGQFDKARDCVAHGIKLYPANAFMYTVLSDIELRGGHYDKAVAAYQQGIKATSGDPNLLWGMANLLIDANKLKEAKKAIEELRKAPNTQRFVDILSARVEYAEGHWLTALQHFENVRGSMVTQPTILAMLDFWTSLCYAQLGNRDQQMQALRRALRSDPSYAPAMQAKANLLIQRGEVDPGLQESLRSQGSAAGLIQRARMCLVEVLRQAPSERDWRPLDAALAEAEKVEPDSPEIAMLRATMLASQGRAVDAEKILLKIRAKYPKQAAVWTALLVLAEHQKDQRKVESLLEESRKSLGDSAEQRLVQAQHFVRCREKDTAQRLRMLADNADQFRMARLRLWIGLFQAALLVGDAEQADSLGKKIIQLQPNNVQVLNLLLDRAIASSDQAAIERALAEIKSVAGECANWFYGQAILLYLKSKDSQDPTPMLKTALDYLARARKSRDRWSKIPLAEGGIYDRLGRLDSALRCYREAIDLGESAPSLLQRTIQILYQTQQVAEADRLLRQLEKNRVSLPSALVRTLVESELQHGENDRAIETARKAIPLDSKDYKDLLWLGRVLGVLGLQAKSQRRDREAGQLLGDAEKAFRRAVELAPTLPGTWILLVQFLKRIGEDGKAEAMIHESIASVLAKDVPLTLAQCYDVANMLDEARKNYETALQATPQDINVVRIVADFYRRTGKLSQAEAQLQRILDGKAPAKESDIVWARRQLATIFLTRGNYKNFQNAKGLIEKNVASPEASAVDRSLLAKLQASDPNLGERGKAMVIWKGLVENRSATPEDILDLANMYMATGNWAEASGLFRDLVVANDADPRYLVFYTEALLKHNEISSAEMYVNRLEKLAPDWFYTFSLRADLLCAANQPLQAFDLLKSFVDKADAEPRDRATRLRAVADMIDRLGRQLTKPSEAPLAGQCAAHSELLYRTYAKENRGHDLVLGVFLGTRGKVDESMNILEEALKTADSEDFSQACSLIVESGKANQKQLQRMDQILQAAMKKFKQPISLMLVTAVLYTRQNRFADAADLYRQVLDKSPDNCMALNNLAVLQALQGLKLDESLKLINQAIETTGPKGAMLDSRAIVYMAMKNPEKALQDVKDAVADQEMPVRLFHLAQANALAGDARAARSTFDQAVKKGLVKEQLDPLEFPAFEKLRQLPR